jgi:hypothetical protein
MHSTNAGDAAACPVWPQRWQARDEQVDTRATCRDHDPRTDQLLGKRASHSRAANRRCTLMNTDEGQTVSTVLPEPAADAATPPAPRRWPAIYTLVTSWTLPATTTARTSHVSLVRAWVIHGFIVLAILATPFALDAWSDVRRNGEPVSRFPGEFIERTATLVRDFQRKPVDAVLFPGIAVGVIEVVFLSVALAVCAFGAQDEHLPSSIRHALRRTWLHTPHVAVAILLAGLLIVELEALRWRMSNDRYEQYLVLHPRPTAPPDSSDVESNAGESHQAAAQKYDQRRRQYAWVDGRSWIEQREVALGTLIVLLTIVWFVSTLCRGISAPRFVQPQERQPLCRLCGYNLVGQPLASRCPECGAPVAGTLGEHATPGPPWQHRARIGHVRAFARTFTDGVRRPTESARKIGNAAPRSHALRYFACNLTLCGMLVVANLMASHYLHLLSHYTTTPLEMTRDALLGLLCALALAAFAGFVALGSGLIVRILDQRNVLAWIGQSVAYGSGYLVLWTAASGILALAVDTSWIVWMELAPLIRVSAGSLQFAAWAIPNIVMGVGYVFHTARGVRGVRYAWR